MSCSPTWPRTRPATGRPIICASWRSPRPRRISRARYWRGGGSFLCKVLQGGTEAALLAELKRDFASVKHVKPPASRSDSAELYLLARGFRGAKARAALAISYLAAAGRALPPMSSAPASGGRRTEDQRAAALKGGRPRETPAGNRLAPIASACLSRNVISTTSAPTATPVDSDNCWAAATMAVALLISGGSSSA